MSNRRAAWALVRLGAALLIAAAVLAQASVTIGGAAEGGRDVATTVVNVFSFFTILSNVASVAVLAWSGTWLWRTRAASVTDKGHPAAAVVREPRRLALALASVTAYMLVTGVVYNTLLRGIELPQGTTVVWANEVLHVVGPLVLLLDLLLAPGRRALGWSGVGVMLVFPIVWVVYTLVRGPWVTNPVTGAPYWYPYPFLDPNNPALQPPGYAGVAVYVVGIALLIGGVAAAVVAVGRRRALDRDAAGVVTGG